MLVFEGGREGGREGREGGEEGEEGREGREGGEGGETQISVVEEIATTCVWCVREWGGSYRNRYTTQRICAPHHNSGMTLPTAPTSLTPPTPFHTDPCLFTHPFSSGMTLPTALAAPVEAGMMFCPAPRPSRHF